MAHFAKGLLAKYPSVSATVISTLALAAGLLTIAGILQVQLHMRHPYLISQDMHVTLLVGLSLVYLSALLRKRKRAAWLVTVLLVGYVLLRNVWYILLHISNSGEDLLPLVGGLALPGLAIATLFISRDLFSVRSAIQNFTLAFSRVALVLSVAFMYGVIGFQILDYRDFRREISVVSGIRYTVDQAGLTSGYYPEPHTKRAHYFLDSLATISFGALAYSVVSLFGPIRFKISHLNENRSAIERLLAENASDSEDFFKLWPQDKAYYVNRQHTAALAYRCCRGVALVVGDPVGKRKDLGPMLADFVSYCKINDWKPAIIHATSRHLRLYQNLGFDVQLIGQEAVIDLHVFADNTSKSKYFRNITNKFAKQGYIPKLLKPPHDHVTLASLRSVSDDWLGLPGRTERGFMMGYFSEEYMQMCKIMVAVGPDGIIKAFVNQIPSPDPKEANFDMLRHSRDSLGNINDFLLVSFALHLKNQGFERLNMGLCPLSGLDKKRQGTSGILGTALRFVYANGDKFYSFSGLWRFKSKYNPVWRDRYIIYGGGIREFGLVVQALVKAMKVK